MPELYLDGNDHVIRFRGGYTIDLTTGHPVYLTASATVTVTLLDAEDESEVVGETWPVSLSYIGGSKGDFIGVLRDGITVTPGQQLIGRVTADNGADQYLQRDVEVLVVAPRI